MLLCGKLVMLKGYLRVTSLGTGQALMSKRRLGGVVGPQFRSRTTVTAMASLPRRFLGRFLAWSKKSPNLSCTDCAKHSVCASRPLDISPTVDMWQMGSCQAELALLVVATSSPICGDLSGMR